MATEFSTANEQISLLAIEYACDLILLGVENIRDRLYSFGRIPLSDDWLRRFPGRFTVSDAIIGDAEGMAARLLSSAWAEMPPPIHNDKWRMFFNRDPATRSTGPTPFKLYINLHPDCLIAEFPTVLHHLTDCKIPVFKFSKDICNFLRPDKFVVYISDFDTLQHLVQKLSASLTATSVQPLPFTATFRNCAAISAGFDPPAGTLKQYMSTSWRGFITKIIVQYIAEGVRLQLRRDVLREYCLDRIRMIGIDAGKWIPQIMS